MASKIVSVVGARPNFMKVAALCEAIKEYNSALDEQLLDHVLVHTGQHYDANISICLNRMCSWKSAPDPTQRKLPR
jgi:UDP-N-acetylglucosamine 2-epimerase